MLTDRACHIKQIQNDVKWIQQAYHLCTWGLQNLIFVSGFSHDIHGSQDSRGKGEVISFHRHLDISRTIIADSSPLYIAKQPDSNREPLVSERKPLTTKLRSSVLHEKLVHCGGKSHEETVPMKDIWISIKKILPVEKLL